MDSLLSVAEEPLAKDREMTEVFTAFIMAFSGKTHLQQFEATVISGKVGSNEDLLTVLGSEYGTYFMYYTQAHSSW